MRGFNTFYLIIVPTFVVASTLGLMYALPGPDENFSLRGNEGNSPMEVLLKGNVEFINKPAYQEAREKTSKSQHPIAVVVTCSDSRVSPELLFQQNLGQLFVVRTAGELIDSLEMGSIEYAVEHLHVPLIIVLGHNNCGAVQAYLSHATPDGDIKKIVNMIGAEVEVKQLENQKNTDLQDYIVANIRHNANSIYRKSKVIQHKFENKEVQIVSAVYDLETGQVSLLNNKKKVEVLP